MTHRRTVASSVVLALALLISAATPSARDDEFVVIVHPNNNITSIDRELLRAAYLKEAVKWRDGSVVVPIALPEAIPAHERFVERVVGKTLSQLRNYWIQRIFSGKGVPPRQAQSVQDAIAHVLADPQAVSYLPAGAEPGRAKIVPLRD